MMDPTIGLEDEDAVLAAARIALGVGSDDDWNTLSRWVDDPEAYVEEISARIERDEWERDVDLRGGEEYVAEEWQKSRYSYRFWVAFVVVYYDAGRPRVDRVQLQDIYVSSHTRLTREEVLARLRQAIVALTQRFADWGGYDIALKPVYVKFEGVYVQEKPMKNWKQEIADLVSEYVGNARYVSYQKLLEYVKTHVSEKVRSMKESIVAGRVYRDAISMGVIPMYGPRDVYTRIRQYVAKTGDDNVRSIRKALGLYYDGALRDIANVLDNIYYGPPEALHVAVILLKEGYTRNEIYRYLVRRGLGYRRKEFLIDMRLLERGW